MEITLEVSYSQPLLQRVGKVSNYPPYDFLRVIHESRELYLLEIAVAGFAESELKVELIEDFLTVTSNKGERYEHCEYLYKGIGSRNFKHIFRLDPILEITDKVSLKDGVLRIVFAKKNADILRRQLFPINGSDNTPKLT